MTQRENGFFDSAVGGFAQNDTDVLGLMIMSIIVSICFYI